MKLTFLIVFLVTLVAYIKCEPKLDGGHVCSKTITRQKDVRVSEPLKYTIPIKTVCGLFFSCSKNIEETRPSTSLKSITEEVLILECCSGYAENKDGRCVPICLDPCNNGKCVKPGVCKCNPTPTDYSPGFVGHTCARYSCLAKNRWGANCDRECNCAPNSYCSANSGKCLCLAGWRGTNCTERCVDCPEQIEPPFMLESEANVIEGTAQKLLARNMASELDGDSDETTKSANVFTSHITLNLTLLAAICILLCAVVWYRKQLHRLKDDLYTAYSTGSSSNNSDYSPESGYASVYRGNIRNRPGIATPVEDNFLAKNLSFATTTRNILQKGEPDMNKKEEHRHKIIADPLLEAHLIQSQKSSEQNIYSDIGSNISGSSYANRCSSSARIQEIPEELAVDEEDHSYQVPRVQSPSIGSIGVADDPSFYGHQLNIYEEIQPKPLPKNHEY